jgi:hypothetical protein
MIAVKPAGYFADRTLEGRFSRFMRTPEPTEPAGPGPIVDWTVSPAPTVGDYLVTVHALPAPGDLAHWGDGLGVITAIEWRQDEDDPVSFGSLVPQSIFVTAPSAASIGVRVRASAGDGPWADADVEGDVSNLLLGTDDPLDDLVTEAGGQILLGGG